MAPRQIAMIPPKEGPTPPLTKVRTRDVDTVHGVRGCLAVQEEIAGRPQHRARARGGPGSRTTGPIRLRTRKKVHDHARREKRTNAGQFWLRDRGGRGKSNRRGIEIGHHDRWVSCRYLERNRPNRGPKDQTPAERKKLGSITPRRTGRRTEDNRVHNHRKHGLRDHRVRRRQRRIGVRQHGNVDYWTYHLYRGAVSHR